tara:strand:- start:558 stop:908 length:351 start_codon:yes stop_codon:yes gene_type:complete
MPEKCVFCKSTYIVKNGLRKRNVRLKQSFLCKSCGRQFVEPDGFERMRHKKEIIVRAIHMHIDGMSLFKTQTHLWQHDGIKVTRWTISQWTKKYSSFLKSAASKSKAKAKRKAAYG